MSVVGGNDMRIVKVITTISVLLIACGLCSCSKNKNVTDTESYWYGCSSYTIPATYGYNQILSVNIYTEGFYYFAVDGQKIDETVDGPDNYNKLYKVDSEGNEISSITMPEEWAQHTLDTIVNNDKLYFVVNNGTEYVVDVNTGDIVSEVHDTNTIGFYPISDGYVKLTNNQAIRYTSEDVEVARVDVENVFFGMYFYERDGRYFLVDGNGFTQTFYEIDFTNNRVLEVFESNITMYGNGTAMLKKDTVFSSVGVYEVDVDLGALIPITEWSYVDIKPAYKPYLYEDDMSYGNGRFGKLYIYKDNEIEVIIFNKIPSSVYANRTPITVGGYDVSMSLAVKWAVYKFNTSQDEYRVYIDDYWDEYSYTSGEEASAQIVSLIQYFNEGNSPDIYYGTNFDYRYMYNSGLVADMLPIIENDPDFSLDELVPSIRDTVTRDGVCYQMFCGYIFNGDFGLRSVFGDEDVTYRMLDELAIENGISIRGDMQSAEFADQILRYPLGDLIDNATGEHIVSIDELHNIVDFSIRNGISSLTWASTLADLESVHDGQYLSCRNFLFDLYYLASEETRLDDSFVYLGFPSVYGGTHCADPDGLVAISADTEYQEACWQFVKLMLSEELQIIEIGNNNNPVVQSVLEDYCNYAMNPELVTDSDSVWSGIVNGRDAVPEWVVNDYRAMVNSIDSVISYDWGLYVLICDEINSYDLQNKSIDAIAESLQSRIDLYVAENYR